MFGTREIKNSEKYEWTQHSIYKMRQYGLSAQRITRVIRNPQRREEGIVKNTVAVMQPVSLKMKNGKKTWSQEIWVMYQTRRAGISNFQFPISKQIQNVKLEKMPGAKYPILNTKYKIISAWRYPGVSPKNNPIPSEILEEISGIA